MSQEEDEYWEDQLLLARRGQLETVRKAATTWAATFTVVLGIFGSVTFVGGLNGLNDLVSSTKAFVQVAVVVAASCTFVATVLTALAANSFPTKTNDLTGDAFRDNAKVRAKRALVCFRVAMGFAAVAAVAVLVGSGVVLLADKATTKAAPPLVVAVVDGVAYCGQLVTEGDQLAVDGQALVNVDSVTIVEACPTGNGG